LNNEEQQQHAQILNSNRFVLQALIKRLVISQGEQAGS
jgi:molybdopterin biosynthesis enzyme